MKSKNVEVVRDYARKLSDEDLKIIQIKLTQRIAGDVAEALDVIQKNVEIDRWLATAKDAFELFDMVDMIEQYIDQEAKRRFVIHEQRPR